jgi:DNA-binding LytR/AlgR family response regulator
MIVTEKISALATRLPQGAFVRTHRSHIVPVARIKRIDAGSVNLGAIDIPVGRTYKSRVRALAEAFGRDRRE